MSLISGTKLGPYEIQSLLGAGGMGEVYRAKDSRLGRDVAIKVLPAEFSSDPVRKQRFEREAKTISGLNHPNICTLYDVGSQDGIEYLVMELVEGETLAQRLEKGPLLLQEVLKYGAQVADGLDKAHRSGVVHRDLKPGNIMLTRTGAKLLDFGLARPAVTSGSLATMTAAAPQQFPMTQEGTIVGTFQYMSPEQVEGREVDARSDIFSLGAVLYEMVTGKRAFEAKSQLSALSAILEKEPEAISTLKPRTPPILDRTIQKCLAKQPDERWQSASDLATQLNWMSDSSSSAITLNPLKARRNWGRVTAFSATVLLLALAVGVGAWMLARRSTPAPQVMRFSINLPPGEALGGSWWWYPSVAIAPDGSQIAYVGHHAGIPQIYVRAVSESSARPIPGTEGAETPFFSPDGEWLGFSSGDKLKKVPLAGGPSVTITNTAVSGASWATDGTIYFGSAGNDSGLFKVTATGGEPQKLTTLDPKHNEIDHRFPEILPGGRALLFVLRNAEQPSFDNADIAALSLATGERKILIKSGTHPHYVSTGHLLFLRAGVLLAVPFDPVRLEVKGAALPVAENILENPRIGAGQYAVSHDGLLVYIPGGVTYGDHELVFVDKAGNARSLTAAKRPYEDFSISPNGHFIATTIEGPVTDTWIHDIDRDTEARFTFGVENRDPTWTPDGKHIAYSGYRDGKYRIFWKPIDGSGPEETLLASDNAIDAWFWTPDGRALLYVEYGTSIGQNIGMLPMDDRQHPRLLFPQQYSVESARVSPDGKLIAFNGEESGRSEVYIAPFPSLAPRERISTDGGMHPMWSPDGRELYYRTGINTEEMEHRALAQRTRVMAVPIETKPILKVGKPRLLFEGPYFESGHDIAVTPDGRGFILIRESDSQSGPNELRVVLHWFEELKQRVPAVR